MKRNFKRLALLSIAIIMILSLVGCGSGSSSDTIIWYMKKPVTDLSHQEQVEAAANEIIQKEIGCKVKFEFVDAGSWSQKRSTLVSSGEEFDIISDAGTEFVAAAQKGAYIDVKDLVEKYGQDIKAKVDDYCWDAVTFDGNVYAIPSQTFYVPYKAVAFKKELVDKYNFDYKEANTPEKLEPFLAKLKANEPDITPLGVFAKAAFPFAPSKRYLDTTISAIVFDRETEKFMLADESPEMIQNRRKTKEWADKGYIASDAISKTEALSELKSQKYAVFTGQRSDVKSTNRNGFPIVEAEPQFGVISSTSVLNSLNAISRTSKKPEKAIQLLNLIWKDRDLSNLLAYGIKDVDYKVVSGEGTDDIKVEPNAGKDVKWSIWHNWLGPLWDQWDSSWNSTESLKQMQELNKNAEKSPIIGFYPNTDSVKTELAAVSTVGTESSSVFATGSMPDFDAYQEQIMQKYKDAGADKLIAEIQRQYEEWKKNKK